MYCSIAVCFCCVPTVVIATGVGHWLRAVPVRGRGVLQPFEWLLTNAREPGQPER